MLSIPTVNPLDKTNRGTPEIVRGDSVGVGLPSISPRQRFQGGATSCHMGGTFIRASYGKFTTKQIISIPLQGLALSDMPQKD